MTTRTGRCTLSAAAQIRQSTARATVTSLRLTAMPRRYEKCWDWLCEFCLSMQHSLPKYHRLFLDLRSLLQVTKRVNTYDGIWKEWNWRSEGDLMLNGAYFTPSGQGAAESYARASSLAAKPSSLVGALTSSAGVMNCRRGNLC